MQPWFDVFVVEFVDAFCSHFPDFVVKEKKLVLEKLLFGDQGVVQLSYFQREISYKLTGPSFTQP